MSEYELVLHGDVWDAVNGLRPDRWVAVDGGDVQGVFEREPESAETVHEVAFLTPGLVDMHVHLVWDGSDDPVATLREQSLPETVVEATRNARAELAGGVTTVRDLGSTDDVAVTVASAIAEGKIPGPRTVASGRTIIISGGHDPFWGIHSDGEDAVRSAVRTLRSRGADLIKVSATGGVYGQAVGEKPGASELSLAELEAIVDEAGRFGLQVAAHAVGREGIRNAVEAGVDTVEHGNLMDAETLSLVEERDVALDPTLFTYRNIATNDAVPAYARANAQTVYERHGEVFEEALERDVRVLAGSDAGSPELPHPSLHRELECMVELGQDPEDALASATSRAAAQLDRPELGVVEPGTPADLVGFAGDPRADISRVESPPLVVKGGVTYRSP
ncbi:MAG: amidohydrolase family protein [Haloferacaceae archaeon]